MNATVAREDELVFAAAASGATAAPAAVMQTALGVLFDGVPLQQALDAPRLLHAGVPDLVHYESTLEPEARLSLEERGHLLAPFEPLGYVNALHCPQRPGGTPGECLFRSDRRGFGLWVGH